ncbi:MerR family transcriptional regulator [uncultured Aeromicrobium sp.]|uniref:MerR family transcriptional regulator n=1 Tax=uncultured Aeromicrobium sp. TaxID=337820 RepID=UPI0025DB8111|nr:MerR family transcriptional regulator [uncultured Aeromicrobium sp.]
MADGDLAENLSVEQLASRVGMSVRTVRFYAGRGLIPAPRREGRHVYYGPDHIARLELVRELQAHGFTLSAIEGYLEKIPEDASPAQVALHRTLLAPWMPELPETLTRAQLVKRAGRDLTDDDLDLLVALGIVEPTPTEDVFSVASAHLGIGVGLLEIGMPLEAAHEARRIFTVHGQQIAQDLTELFRTSVWPKMKESGQTEGATAIIERFKPLTIAALVTAYEQAVDEMKRETIRRRR